MIIKTKALVIKEYIVGESDKYITLFTKDLGKIQVIAAKAKKHDKGLASSTQLFVYGEFILARYHDTYRLMNVEMIRMFHELRDDLAVLSYGSYVLEFLAELVQAEESSEEVFILTLFTLHSLIKRTSSLTLIRRIFELRAMSLLGFMPELSKCADCGSVLEENPKSTYYFVSEAGGTVCSVCRSSYLKSLFISYSTLYTLKYIIHMPLKQLFSFDVHNAILNELEEVCDHYIAYYTDKSFKTLEFIKQIDI